MMDKAAKKDSHGEYLLDIKSYYSHTSHIRNFVKEYLVDEYVRTKLKPAEEKRK